MYDTKGNSWLKSLQDDVCGLGKQSAEHCPGTMFFVRDDDDEEVNDNIEKLNDEHAIRLGDKLDYLLGRVNEKRKMLQDFLKLKFENFICTSLNNLAATYLQVNSLGNISII
jgi:hypothetical protein